MNPTKVMKALIDGQLAINCVRIDAIQDTSDDPSHYAGPGYIDDRDGNIKCKIFAECNTDSTTEFIKALKAQPGTLYSPTDYFTVTAIGMDGHRWTAPKVLIDTDYSLHFPKNAVVRAKLSELRHDVTLPQPSEDSVELTFSDQDELEWQALMGEWEVGAPYSGYRFRISTLPRAHILVEVRTTATFPPEFDLRLVEALSFVLGDTLGVRARRRTSGIKVSSAIFSLPATTKLRQRFTPLHLKTRPNHSAARELLVRYLQFAGTAEHEGFWHPCSAHLSHARQASNNSLDAWVVGACVALEGVATLLPVKINNSEREVINHIQRAARRWLPEFNVSTSLQDRVNGLLGQLTNVRVIDRLRPLIHTGAIESDYVKAWTDSRNKGVHTAKLNQDDFADPKLQIALTRVFKVHTLLYQLTFELIGYSGPYVDYGTPGFPERNYRTGLSPADDGSTSAKDPG
jgi:hypothetical protein